VADDNFTWPLEPAKLQLLRSRAWLSVYEVAYYLARENDPEGCIPIPFFAKAIANEFSEFLTSGGADHLPGAVGAKTGLDIEPRSGKAWAEEIQAQARERNHPVGTPLGDAAVAAIRLWVVERQWLVVRRQAVVAFCDFVGLVTLLWPRPAVYANQPVARAQGSRGHTPDKRNRVKNAMLEDLSTGALTLDGLRAMTEEAMRAQYFGVSRDTARNARREVLSEFVGN
jgi:hypothetical protein